MDRSIDAEIMRIAAARHGAITTDLLAAAGIDRRRIPPRVSNGLLRPLAKGIYVVTPLESRWSTLSAALLRFPSGVAGHQSAARLHGIAVPGTTVDVLVPAGTPYRLPGVTVRETTLLPDVDRTQIDGLPTTSIARTLCDLVTVLGRPRHRHLVQTQLLSGRPTPQELIACHQALARRGRTGTVAMRSLLEELLDDEPYPQSELELRLLTALVRGGSPPLHRQFRPPWYEGRSGIVDLAEPTSRTILEADGRRWHSADLARRDDGERDRRAALHGWLVLRVGWHEVVHRTDATVSEILDVMASRRTTSVEMAEPPPSRTQQLPTLRPPAAEPPMFGPF